jgi:hypothetical protein
VIVDEEVYEHLEHFGVKGMRWGSRKALATGEKSKKTTLTPQQKRERTQKRVIIGVTAGIVLAGSLFAAKKLKDRRYNQQLINSVGASTIKRGADYAESFVVDRSGTHLPFVTRVSG